MSKFVYVTYIVTTPRKVWDALTDGEVTKQYWASHTNESDWKTGSTWEHRASSGNIDVAGTIIETNPPHRLVYSWATTADLGDAAKTSRVSFDIAEHKPGVVKLTVIHDELADGSKMETDISRGWPQVLSNLKTLLETGHPAPMW